jgi:hypothetical protein
MGGGGGAINMPKGLEKKRNPLLCAVRNLSNQKRFGLTIEAWWQPHPMWLG